MIKESVRKKKFKNKKTIIFAFFLAVAVAIAGVGSSTVNVNAGDSYVDWKELSELDGFGENTSKTVALNGDYKVTQNTTITATWTENTYEVTYVLNGATTNPNPETFKYSEGLALVDAVKIYSS